jgi:aldehyde:ferredoxin oxidoreductase
MNDWYGWAGMILDVDLTTGTIERQPLGRKFALDHLGGLGFGMRTLYDEVGPETDPLAPESVISIGNGPLAGTLAPCSGRIDVVAKSPLTGIFARSNAGGFWGNELKWAGYDLLRFRGAAERPVYLLVEDDRVMLRDASHLWGLDVFETEEQLRRELKDRDLKTLRIGPAGENMSFSAAIMNDLGRAAATRGLAAILGAKKLKAVAVRGKKGVRIARPKALANFSRQLSERFKRDPMYDVHRRYGTNYWVGDTVLDGIERFSKNPDFNHIRSDAFNRLYEKNLSCSACPLGCSHFFHIKSGPYTGTKGEGVEGNTQLAGLSFQIFDAAFVCRFNHLCNQLGLDTMGTTAVIEWGMRLYQHGVITEKDTDGVVLKYGSEAAVWAMIEQMAWNREFGAVLNVGIVKAAELIGRGADEHVSHNKHYPAYGPGFMSSVKTTFAHAIATRGHDHLTGSPGIETPDRQPEITRDILERLGRERYGDPGFFTETGWDFQPKYALRVRDVENRYAMADMLGTCKFGAREVLLVEGIGMADFAELMTLVTGEPFTETGLHEAAQREMILERAYNAREGVRKIDDYPHAFYWELKYGRCHPRYKREQYRMTLEDYTQLLETYYVLRDCDPSTGIPTRSGLEKAGLEDVAADLTRRGLLSNKQEQ